MVLWRVFSLFDIRPYSINFLNFINTRPVNPEYRRVQSLATKEITNFHIHQLLSAASAIQANIPPSPDHLRLTTKPHALYLWLHYRVSILLLQHMYKYLISIYILSNSHLQPFYLKTITNIDKSRDLCSYLTRQAVLAGDAGLHPV